MSLASLRRSFVTFAIAALAGWAIAAANASAAVQQAPGSRVKMDLPKGFEVSDLFSGFIYPAAQSSVVIAELPTAKYDQIVAGFTDAALARKGINNVKRSTLERKDTHIYLQGTQTSRGNLFEKHVLLIKNSTYVAVITANVVPSSFTDGFFSRADLRKALVSVALTEKPAPIVKQFTLSHLGAFKEAGKLVGSAILYTTNGQLAPRYRGESRSMVIVGPSIDRVELTDVAGYSERALRGLPGYADLKIAAGRPVTIGGLKGIRIEATARSTTDPKNVIMRQVVLVRPGGGFFRLIAIVLDSEKALMADVEKLLASFTPVR
ncbi:MAG: hypothetical protein ACR2PA_19765 [Hyphomicrobiaceae bacterium]